MPGNGGAAPGGYAGLLSGVIGLAAPAAAGPAAQVQARRLLWTFRIGTVEYEHASFTGRAEVGVRS